MEHTSSPPAPAGDGKREWLVWRVHDAVLNVVTVFLLGGILVLMVLQIFTRYVLSSPLTWTEELTRNFQVWLTFFGGVVMVRDGASICIDAVYNLLPEKVRAVCRLFTTALSLVFLAVLAVYGMRFALLNWNTYSLVTGLCMGHVYLPIPICAVLMMVNLVRAMKGAVVWKS